MKKLLILLPLLAGCSTQNKSVKVLQSPTEIKEYRLYLDDGDKVVCDPTGCRKI